MAVLQPVIDVALVHRLVAAQFPHLAELPIQPVQPPGWDNRSFRLGDEMLVRLPSAAAYAPQVEREHQWLPRLAAHLPVPIPAPLALGEPSSSYPWRWSIYRWISGQPVHGAMIRDPLLLANDLAVFLSALQAIDATGGPPAGPESFYRGGSLAVYADEARHAAEHLGARVDPDLTSRVLERALGSSWNKPPVWVHGDISAGNVLVRDGRLSGVIDFGQLAIGDPACDLAAAWTLFDNAARVVFRRVLHLDRDTWARGRGWALWKALIVAANPSGTNPVEGERCWRTIEEVLADCARTDT
jgi:aminoglycoside phosphotransferase (APT) family kinase protein